MIVARNIAIVAANARTAHFVKPEAVRFNAEMIQNISARDSRIAEKARQTWFQAFFGFYERVTIRGLALHQALRKLQIEQSVREAVDEGFEQFVVLGGGLDTLALRLYKQFQNVNFLEIDHPATQKIKLETIEKQKLRGGNLNFLAVDFTRETLEENLNSCPHFLQNAKTVFVCEGVLMYLDDAEVARIFSFIRNQTNAAQRFIFTFMERGANGKIDFRRSTVLVRLWLKWKNEPFKWGLHVKELDDFLSKSGFRLKDLTTAQTFRQKYLTKYGLADEFIAEGENICVCETLP